MNYILQVESRRHQSSRTHPRMHPLFGICGCKSSAYFPYGQTFSYFFVLSDRNKEENAALRA
jgi:hypothetical protein